MNDRNTTCDHVLELLPLHVGEDLDAETAAGLAAIIVPAVLLRGGGEATPDLVQVLPTSAMTTAETGVETLASTEPAPVLPTGLVPIRDRRDSLSTQLEPVDPRYELTSSPVR